MGTVVIEEELDLTAPVLIEGLPGVGLVGKIATDHTIDELDMDQIGFVDCDGLPTIATYEGDSHEVQSPVRLYADEDEDLLALQSDIPVSKQTAPGFASTLIGWIQQVGIRALFLSGLPSETSDPAETPAVYGLRTGGDGFDLAAYGVDPPEERGVVAGPTGALLNRAHHGGVDACGLIVESDPQFPDPAAARQLITRGIEPIGEVSIPTDDLVDRAEEIRTQKEALAKRMQEANEDESSQAQPLRMYQ
ncbi:MAG: proteasome assembly chaperone family protein [Halodesulfurarchaeum sp.]